MGTRQRRKTMSGGGEPQQTHSSIVYQQRRAQAPLLGLVSAQRLVHGRENLEMIVVLQPKSDKQDVFGHQQGLGHALQCRSRMHELHVIPEI